LLTRGWFCFVFKSSVDAELVLKAVWVVNQGSLMLKRWHCAFNPDKECFRFRHLWVLLPGCPLALWSLEAFKEIGNALGKFLHVDSKLLSGLDRRMGKILVEVDTFGGLPTELEIIWRGKVILQCLDYLGISFKCIVCKETRHLRHQCPGKPLKDPPEWDSEVSDGNACKSCYIVD
jgi:hypothetical protein